MSKIGKILHPLEGFQYSVNVFYDFHDEQKIKSYIPTVGSLQIIEEILRSTEDQSTDRTRILTGAYGKGKSHLVLCLAALLSGGRKDLFHALIYKARQTDPELALRISAFLQSGKKFLPVIVNANSLDLRSTLLQSLNESLRQSGLSGIMPVTFYDVAVNKILDWKQNFSETLRAFETKIGQKAAEFIEDLRAYNQGSYDFFVKIYPSLTSGSEFNPLAGADVISVYESVVAEIRKIGYSGIFVVYDEFGKFLEGSVDRSSSLDIKLLQDFAEKCNRSGEAQLHLLLISHKDIENYIGKLSKEKVDAWKAVSNRFKPITINANDAEIYDMVSTVLYKDETLYKDYVKDHSESFERLQKVIDTDHSFESIRKMVGKDLAQKCYPLHPYTLLLLPKISELVAQNERTIFTFLSSSEKYTVSYFLRNTDKPFPLMEPDYVYDYFEKLFRVEPYGSEIKKQWQVASNALAKVKEYDNPLAEKMLKTIALIYCVNNFELVPPSWDIIDEIYSVNYSFSERQVAKQILDECHLIIELLFKPYVRISETSGHDVNELIKDETYRLENRISLKEVFINVSETRYLYPVQYNDENEIVRFFRLEFIEDKDLEGLQGGLAQDGADGIVFAILLSPDAEIEQIRETAMRLRDRCSIFVLPRKGFDYAKIALEYQAISNLIDRYKTQEVSLLDELSYILDDRRNLLVDFINNTYLRPENKQQEYIYEGKVKKFSRRAQLSQLLSDIMRSVYFNTPIVINELINKNELTSPIKTARQKLISAIFAGHYKSDMGFIGNGPELNILRSTLIAPGIFVNGKEAQIQFANLDSKVAAVLQEIRTFITGCVNGHSCNFGEIYEILTSPKYGYGLKRGLIPIYLSVVINDYKEYIAISKKGREIPLSATLMSDIDIAPNTYFCVLEKWDDAKSTYLLALERIYFEYISDFDRSFGAYVYVVRAMRRWYLQFSRFESTTKKYCDENGEITELDRGTVKLKVLLSNPEINSHEFIFEKLPECYKASNYEDVITGLRSTFEKLNNNLGNYKRKMLGIMREQFSPHPSEESVGSIVANFYDDLKPRTKEHLFSGRISAFLNVIKAPSNDEGKLIEDIVRAIFGLRLGDLSDDLMAGFERELCEIKKQIEQYNCSVSLNQSISGGYKITFTDESGEEVTRQFDEADPSPHEEELYNEITETLDSYGESIATDGKRQVLFKILKELK